MFVIIVTALCVQFSKINNSNNINDGSAVAIKQFVQYKMDVDFDTMEIKTTSRKVTTVPTNLPL